MDRVLDTFSRMVIPATTIETSLFFIREELKKDERYKKAIQKVFKKER